MSEYADMTKEQLRVVVATGEAAQAELNRRYVIEEKAVLERCNSGEPPFKDEELVFAKSYLCQCGERVAYPKGIGPFQGFWDCVGLLKRTAPPKGHPAAKVHTDRLPFIFWNIKSEDQR